MPYPEPYPDWWANFALDAGVILLAVVLDRLAPEPPERIHPVVWLGRLISRLERSAPKTQRASRLYGAGAVIVSVVSWGGLTWLAIWGLSGVHPVLYLVGGAVILRTSFTVRGLLAAGELTRQSLAEGDLDRARERAGALVSRDRSSLTEPLVAAAVIESVAENTTDSYISPWLAFAVLGVPGAIAYRAANTLDSMWGKRGRYEHLGKFAARFDDVLNYIPARLSALLLLLTGATLGWPVRRGTTVMLRDQRITESPNAGWTMAAMAGLLGRCLEKRHHYTLGREFPEPTAPDIARASRLAAGAAILSLPAAIALLALRHWLFG